MNNPILKFFTAFSFLLLPLTLLAVTSEEMEQARTIAAKSYLRYANDGSGYLDDLNPKTMAELEAALKTKEKENIKAFKAIPVPSDYKDWNKEKLVDYWAVTAFQDKGLLEKGKGGRIRARSLINKMTIAPPAPAAQPQASSTGASQTEKTDESSTPETPEALLDSLSNINPVQVDNEIEQEQEFNVDKASNYTWVYIMVLAILVAIVVALVVYAANVMKKNGSRSQSSDWRNVSNDEEVEHYQSLIADKDVEIAMLKKKLEAASKQNNDLKARLDEALGRIEEIKASVMPKVGLEQTKKEISTDVPPAQKSGLRSIYLGRANSRGIFVRADRTLNVGNSVFILDTSDGFSGTFRVADSPAAWSLALSNPAEYLETACTGHNLDNTANASEILTESAGTAVFEGGCWRVIRKARIRYE